MICQFRGNFIDCVQAMKYRRAQKVNKYNPFQEYPTPKRKDVGENVRQTEYELTY